MPWKVSPVPDLRLALRHAVRSAGRPVTDAAADFGVSRKTAHKWLARFDAAGPAPADAAGALADRSRRPLTSPATTAADAQAAVLAVRDRRGWGPRKIHFFLAAQAAAAAVPPVRTVAAILKRHGRVGPPAPPAPDPQRFERPRTNDLWQVDFKGAVEVGHRTKLMPFTVLDDHSRYLLAFRPCPDVTMATAWSVLWDVMGTVGLPEQVLCDNAFATMGTASPAGVSWFESRLLRLGVGCSHGRPYHPQTQGKVERLHGSAARELIARDARRDTAEHFAADCDRWRHAYNADRPHEAIGDVPPAARYRPSDRPRPAALPDPEYPAGSVLRVVSDSGQITVANHRILLGRGIAGDRVRVEDRGHELAVFYCQKQVRLLSRDQLVRGKVL